MQATLASGYENDVTSKAKLTSADPSVVTVDDEGMLRPASNGRATVEAEISGVKVAVTVEVRDFDKPFVPSFLNDVQPVLTKGGCNSGACHGSEAGKNGFKLSLRGYDPEFDHAVLTRQANGRRVARWAPEHSLMLRKPTLTLPHQGGKRFAVDSPEFRVLSEWIANGAPAPLASDTVIESLSVFPEQAWLTPGAEQQVLVQANYSDGTSRDVTRWVKFSSTDSGVATVNGLGQVKMQGAGQAAITVWYSSKVVFARVGVAFDHKIDAKVYAEAPKNNYTTSTSWCSRSSRRCTSLLREA